MLDRITTEFDHDSEDLPRGYAIVTSDRYQTLLCLPRDATEKEVDELIVTMADEMKTGEDVIRSRLFSGVQCPFHKDRVHLAYYSNLGLKDEFSLIMTGEIHSISQEDWLMLAKQRREQIEEAGLSVVDDVPFSIGGSDA